MRAIPTLQYLPTFFHSLSGPLDSMRDPTASSVPGLSIQRGMTDFIALSRGIVEGMSIDAGISCLLALQSYHFDLGLGPSRITLALLLFWMKRL